MFNGENYKQKTQNCIYYDKENSIKRMCSHFRVNRNRNCSKSLCGSLCEYD
jgi:hypothetical protein